MPAQSWSEVLRALRGGSSRATEVLLDQAVALGHDVAAGMVGCSLTEFDGDRYRTPVASTELALELDQAQYSDWAGPCVSAARDRRPQQIDLLTTESRFPVFVAAARHRGVRSSLSLPVAGRCHRTALNLYSTVESAFASERAQSVASLVSRVIAAVESPPPASITVMRDALEARARGDRVSAAVEQTMRRTGLDRVAAFAEMTERSRAPHVSIRTIADDIKSGADVP